MAYNWQLLIFSSSALVIAISTVSATGGRESKSVPKSVSYLPSSSHGNHETNIQQSSLRGQLEPSPQASASYGVGSTTNGYPMPLNQPSIYHSIIDRTSSGSLQPASSVQATTTTNGDLHAAAGHHHGHAHGKYYEYREVPKKKTWKFGYKRGNHKHTIERHEHGKAGKHPHFKTKVKWHDKKSKGKGIHLWDYNHHDKKHYHHG